jgi:hypothetical protein
MPSRESWSVCLVIYITFVLSVCSELLPVSVCGQLVTVILWVCITVLCSFLTIYSEFKKILYGFLAP